MNNQIGQQSQEQAASSQGMLNDIVPNNHLTLPMAVVNYLTPQECDDVISLTDNLQINDAEVRTEQSSIQYGKRKSDIRWLPPNEASNWLYLKVQELITSCNANYLYDIRGFFEGMQVATYKDGGHFDWHMDVGADKLSLRKLSATIQLSSPGDYEGGDLEFMGQEILAPKERGTAIVFPAFLYHRVKPVTRGSRTSIVTWVHGSPFK